MIHKIKAMHDDCACYNFNCLCVEFKITSSFMIVCSLPYEKRTMHRNIARNEQPMNQMPIRVGKLFKDAKMAGYTEVVLVRWSVRRPN